MSQRDVDLRQANAQDRAAFAQAIGSRPVWLRQVHGTQVLHLTPDTPSHPDTPADAAWTTDTGMACTVGAADCLPVLLCTRDGRAVAAAHAGWRGLAGGVIEATLDALRTGAGVESAELLAWLGPCIGPRAFEVGADVLAAFGYADPTGADPLDFACAPRADGAPRWRANLQRLARDRLVAAGVAANAVSADRSCTFEQPSRFFSFRRDASVGRMAAAIWRR